MGQSDSNTAFRSGDPASTAVFAMGITQSMMAFIMNLIRGLKDGLQEQVEQHSIKAIFAGTRLTDPNSSHLKDFTPTDPGWPQFVRVGPILEWNYQNVWDFIRIFKVPYCELYDQGYTSIGQVNDTIPNPALKRQPLSQHSSALESDGDYLPAYMLIDGSLERSAQVATGLPAKGSTDKQMFEHIVNSATKVLDQDSLYLVDFLKGDLSLRTFSPRVEMIRKMHHQYRPESATPTQPWIVVNDDISTDLDVASIDKMIKLHTTQQPFKSSINTIFSQDCIFPSTKSYKFDHVILLEQTLPVVIFYGNLVEESSFVDVHQHLRKLQETGRIVYVLRFVVPDNKVPAQLQGFGFGLSVKNLEYKVMDDTVIQQEDADKAAVSGTTTIPNEDVGGFNFAILAKRYPKLTANFATFRKFVIAHSQQDDLKVWEVKDIGVQSVQKIITSSDPMRSLKYISQSFPGLAPSLARISINDTLKSQIVENQKHISAGENLLLINDRVIDLDPRVFDLNPIGFNQILLDEMRSTVSIQQLGVDAKSIDEMSASLHDISPVRFNMMPEQENIIIHLNNPEKDPAYQRWDRSLSVLSQAEPLETSNLYIAKNIFTTVLVVDPSNDESLAALVNVQVLLNNNLPSRFSAIFATDPENVVTEKFAKVFITLKNGMGHRAALFFVNAVVYYKRQWGMDNISNQLVQSAFDTVVGQMGNRLGARYDQIANSQDHNDLLAASNAFIAEKRITTFPKIFINGLLMEASRPLTDTLLPTCLAELPRIKALYDAGIISDSTPDLYTTILSHIRDTEGLLDTLNADVVPSETNPIHYHHVVAVDPEVSKAYSEVMSSLVWHSSPGTQNNIKTISIIVLVNLDSPTSVKTAINALARLFADAKLNSQTRIAIIGSPGPHPRDIHESVSKSLLLPKTTAAQVITLLEAQITALTASTTLNMDQALGHLDTSQKSIHYASLDKSYARQHDFIIQHFGIDLSQTYVIANGRIIKIASDIEFSDFFMLEQFESSKASNVFAIIEKNSPFTGVSADLLTSEFISDKIMRLVTALGRRIEGSTAVRRTLPRAMVPSFTTNADSTMPLRIKMVVDPLCKTAQKMVPVISAISRHYNIAVDVYLNANIQLSELPLKSYYTYVVHMESRFDETGRAVAPPSGTLRNLPESRVLTMAIDAPPEWIVKPIVAKYDLDNIRLRDLGRENALHAVFELEHLVIQGMSADNKLGSFPGGLELFLDPLAKLSRGSKSQDTVIMGNGYFQLKGNPGYWKLAVTGRGSTIVDILNTDSKLSTTQHVVPYLWVVTDSFAGSTIFLQFTRKAGKESEPILPPADPVESKPAKVEDDTTSLFSSLFGKKKPVAAASNETIHIFSVASGHLYERFLKIMMLSVTKNTKSPVKFWFLGNYLSPKFVDFIPHMASKYGFEYELVTYQWPSFLRAQTEKQRIIWAYKILFLDVLFPLSVKKIIFVDADQVVRTDMRELWDMDLQGASIGLTPFCDSNKETEGFRFWKKGYWADHLRGKPYHISALYVVDLLRFRRLIAGDQLRMTYQQLSSDPNSLANLDQDLPNYLQHNVRIFSLPQEWLWCETWCSQESKTKAKTIDLCNNPLTKTPKLENAVRIIGEWTSLDNEAKEVEKELEKKRKPVATDASKNVDPASSNEKLDISRNQDILQAILEAQQSLN
eukprot:gene2909-3343_t